jgi:alpha/beta superfamily hydrolase
MTDVTFTADDRLKGIYEEPEGGEAWGGVVVAHPHPLHGATMDQPVVYRTAQACRKRGLATLRFNFRGVGESGGTYSGFDEYRDVQAAAAYMRARLDALDGESGLGSQSRPLALAGYSFGSIMAAMAVAGEVPVRALALIAFVVTWKDMLPAVLDKLATFSGPVLAVCGENDEIAPPQEVERVLARLKLDFSLSVVEGADHFFGGVHREVGERVAAFLDDVMGHGGGPRSSDADAGVGR